MPALVCYLLWQYCCPAVHSPKVIVKTGWVGVVGSGRDMDAVREDFFQVTWGS